MKLKYRFLGRFSEDLKDIELPDDVKDGSMVSDIRATMAALAPEVADRLQSCMIAVNTEYASDEQVLVENDEIAFLPPVSGG